MDIIDISLTDASAKCWYTLVKRFLCRSRPGICECSVLFVLTQSAGKESVTTKCQIQPVSHPVCYLVCLSDCLVILLFCCLVVCVSACLVVWLSGCLIVWLSDCRIVCLFCWFVVWLSGCFVVWLSAFFIVWLSDCLVV